MRRGFIALLAIGVLGAVIALPSSADAACFGWKSEVFWCDDDWFRRSEASPDEGPEKPEATATPRATVTKTPADTPTSTPVATVTKTPADATSTPRAVVTKTPGTATATATPAPTVTPTPAPVATPMPTPKPTGTPSAPTTVKSGKVLQSFGLTRDGRTLSVPVYSSFPLSETNEAVTHAVLVVHGTNRNAVDYFDYADAAVPSSVLVVAPRFQTADDSPETNELYWTSGEWKQGGQSTGSRPWEMSSFTVVDELLRSMRATFPNLDTIVVAGHSGGGQFVQRYAATNRDGRNHFVVANPSSYMFLNGNRPESTSGCSWYNEYRYGLDDLNDVPYVEAIGATTLRSRYETARVTYLLGANDTDEDASDLDTTCGAEAQGPNRRERGENFYQSLESVYGRGVYDRHTLRIVSGVGHSAREMFGSSAGRAALAE